jgi:hypothetical protein
MEILGDPDRRNKSRLLVKKMQQRREPISNESMKTKKAARKNSVMTTKFDFVLGLSCSISRRRKKEKAS